MRVIKERIYWFTKFWGICIIWFLFFYLKTEFLRILGSLEIRKKKIPNPEDNIKNGKSYIIFIFIFLIKHSYFWNFGIEPRKYLKVKFCFFFILIFLF